MPVPTAFAASALYDSLLQNALQRFLSRATLEVEASLSESSTGTLAIEPTADPCELVLRWFGTRHILHVPRAQPFTSHELRVARAIGEVLSARYRAIFDPAILTARADLFQGMIEDRYVAAFLDRRPYEANADRSRADRLASCIEVLRVAALSSYESRAISSGVLVLGEETTHERQHAARLYGHALTVIKSFYRLCDGLHTVFLIGPDGLLLDIIDITHRARHQIHPAVAVASPCPSSYRQHAAATLGTGDTCIVLTPSHEIKVFAEGAHVFTFRNAQWHLIDVEAKYGQWLQAVGSPSIAEKLFQCALDMADRRQGALLVVLRDRAAAGALVAPVDRLDLDSNGAERDGARRPLHYLLRGRKLDDVEDNVMLGLASLDGATVVDAAGRLIAAGAILMHPHADTGDAWVSEGARTTAAQTAGQFGPVLKVSTDGMITCYDGRRLWDI